MSGFIDADGSALVGGQLPSSVGQSLQLDAAGNLKVTSAGSGAGQQNVNLNQVNGSALSSANPVPVVNQAASSVVYQPGQIARTVSGQTVDLSVGQFRELAIDIYLSAFSGGGGASITFTVQRKGADGFYYAIATSVAFTAVAIWSKSIGAGLETSQSFGDVVNVAWTITGTAPSMTFNISIKGK